MADRLLCSFLFPFERGFGFRVRVRCLFEGHPDGRREVLRMAVARRENIDSAIRFAFVALWTRNSSCCPCSAFHGRTQSLTPFSKWLTIWLVIRVYRSCFSVRSIVFLLYDPFIKLHSLVVERCSAERPEQSQGSRFVAFASFTL